MRLETNERKRVPARVLIVDDHPLVREGLAARIARYPDLELCGEAEDVPGAMTAVASLDPDVVIVDLSLKRGDGLDLVKRLHLRKNPVAVLVSSMHDEMVYAERVLEAGALGYVDKQEAPEKLIEAIRTVLAGKVYLSARMTERLVARHARGQPGETPSPVSSLTDRELEVFRLIGGGLTTREIAERLGLSVKTIESHRENVKSKLRVRSAAELTHTAVQWVIANP